MNSISEVGQKADGEVTMNTITTFKSHYGTFYLGQERQRDTPDGRSFTGVSKDY